MKFITIFIIVLILSGCSVGGNSRNGDGGNASTSIPITVQKVDYGQICYSQAGGCPMYQPLVVGSLCYCQTPYGNAPGKVGQ
ncbi:hypothetical protein NBRC116592_27940 [Colwellia sp. KU-HH00111]|uniref:hypothetical protein n=1 Tax=Colwellia sp. KU-HH00111 TaxID=3127652 RepID=UPI00310BCB65